MALDNGYVMLWRSMLTWEWHDDPPTFTVYVHLILSANIDDVVWHGITIKRGSLVSSYAKIAKRTGLSIQQARTAISHLELTGELTRSPYQKFTVFTLNNYDKFQDVTSKSPARRTKYNKQTNNQSTSNQQRNNKDNKDNKETINKTPPSGEIPETPIFVEEEVMEI